MSKLAIVVEPHFLERHVGVRNYTFSLASLLARHCHTDFLSFVRSEAGQIHWFKIKLRNPSFAIDGGSGNGNAIHGQPPEVYHQWLLRPHEESAVIQNDLVVYTHFGPNLAREQYDACLITNPWLLNFDTPIPIAKQFGVAYDTIPNRYALTNINKPFSFASEHLRGYEYYKRHCRATFAISESTRTDLTRLFGFQPDHTVALPPLLPCSYFDSEMPTHPRTVRGPSVVLASPLDPRKGLDILPQLINPLVEAELLDTVLMYGSVRCSKNDLERFFNELNPDTNVCWYPRASARIVKRLLASARLCLFPSTSEGLGLPVLEAQICGCRVLARDIDPVNRNLLTGSILLGETPGNASAAIRDAVKDEEFDHDGLRAEALQRFGVDTVDRVLVETMGLPDRNARPGIYPPQRTAA